MYPLFVDNLTPLSSFYMSPILFRVPIPVLYYRAQKKQAQNLKCPTSAEYRGRIIFLNLQVTFLVVLLRKPLAFFATKPDCFINFLPTRNPPRSFSADDVFQTQLAPSSSWYLELFFSKAFHFLLLKKICCLFRS